MTVEPRVTSPLPSDQRYSSRNGLQPVCRKCGRGYGSKLDGICTTCHGGKTAWESYRNHDIR